MKTLHWVVALGLLAVVSAGCQHGKWRLRGAKCRPGMSMPTYTQPQPPPQMGGQPQCNPGYPPTGFVPQEYASPGVMQSSGYVPEGNVVSGNVIMQEFPTTPIEDQTQVLQRPYVTSPVSEPTVTGSEVITVPGPEQGPLPSH
jgi:hypothetical protein